MRSVKGSSVCALEVVSQKCLQPYQSVKAAERGQMGFTTKDTLLKVDRYGHTRSIFTALHGLQTPSCDENSVRLSVRQMREL